MAHFAQLDDNNIVTQVIVVANEELLDNGVESEEKGIAFCKSLFGENTRWKQTSYNNTKRKNYAGINYYYDEIWDAFREPQPYLSWKLNYETFQWEPPIPMPPIEDGYVWKWGEVNKEWIKTPVEK